METKNTGRPTLLTPETQAAICGAVEVLSLPLRHAAAAAGVSYFTVRDWVRLGEADMAADPPRESIHATFARELARARAAKVRKLTGLILTASETPNAYGVMDPKPAMWLLERTEPRDFAPLQKIEAEVNAPTTDAKAELAAMLDKLSGRAAE